MTSTNSRISESGILNTSLAAMMKAGRDYEKWTYGFFPPWKAPEYIYTTTVAQKIAKQPYRPNVYCEYNSKDAKKGSNLTHHRLPNRELGDRSRTDILITGQDDIFRHAIEVKKRVWNSSIIATDIKRLADLVVRKKATTILSGISIFFICYEGDSRSKAREKLENSLEKNLVRYETDDRYAWLIRGARNALKDHKECQVNLHKSDEIAFYEDQFTYWAWASAALVVKPAISK